MRNEKINKGEFMSYVYQWKVSNGDEVFVEYCWSSIDKCIKVVEMKVNGKFHRVNWMSKEGREELMELLKEGENAIQALAALIESKRLGCIEYLFQVCRKNYSNRK